MTGDRGKNIEISTLGKAYLLDRDTPHKVLRLDLIRSKHRKTLLSCLRFLYCVLYLNMAGIS